MYEVEGFLCQGCVVNPLLFESQSDCLVLEVESGHSAVGAADGIWEGLCVYVCVCEMGEIYSKQIRYHRQVMERS